MRRTGRVNISYKINIYDNMFLTRNKYVICCAIRYHLYNFKIGKTPMEECD